MRFDYRIRTGDILLDKGFGLEARLVRRFLPDTVLSWPSGRQPKGSSTHNGILGEYREVEGVFEIYSGTLFHFTPWADYDRLIQNGSTEAKIVRADLSEDDAKRLNEYLISRLQKKIPYDFRGTMASLFPIFGGSRRKWYCTEAVREGFGSIGRNFLEDEFPSPASLERLVQDGILREVADFYRPTSALQAPSSASSSRSPAGPSSR